jgi:uncharacterized OB-fold protein
MMPELSEPIPDRDSAPYWEALRAGRFEIQQCLDCGGWSWPPRPICSHCQGDVLVWREPSGTGEVHSWVVSHRPFVPTLKDAVPYTIAMVRLDEQSDILIPGRLLDADGVHQGMRVRAVPTPVGEDAADVCWEPI